MARSDLRPVRRLAAVVATLRRHLVESLDRIGLLGCSHHKVGRPAADPRDGRSYLPCLDCARRVYLKVRIGS